MALLELSVINIENFSKIKAVERARLTELFGKHFFLH